MPASNAPAVPPPEGSVRGPAHTVGGRTPQATQEIRIALVLYGGVSLAIYINGIVQELLNLVRATAPGALDPPPDAPVSTQRVYRTLGRLLRWSRPPLTLDALPADSPVTTRFLIDVVSGTSAGGINGIFLAKALTTGKPMTALKSLWVEEADLGVLLNDKTSTEGLGLDPPDPPAALLNGSRMFVKLMDALEDIDAAGEAERVAGLVDELDLYVTTTDIRGATVALKLSNTVAPEKLHKQVFHFKYATAQASGEAIDEFRALDNPSLAFAARCTSAFPFAFEPFTVAAANRLLKQRQPPSAIDAAKFLNAYSATRLPVSEWPMIAFGDGGYLDNKPFGHVIEGLRARRADVPVLRKLIFIDPSPEIPRVDPRENRTPDALENLVAAAFTIPRYETIREDLEVILDRNRLIERQKGIAEETEPDIALASTLGFHVPNWSALDPRTVDLARLIRAYGPGYGPYHRLRLARVTDEIALLVTRVAGFQENSDEWLAIRTLVREWRRATYIDYLRPSTAGGERPGLLPEPLFLFDFDIEYRIRRLQFLVSKIDELTREELVAETASLATGVNLVAAFSGEGGRTRFNLELNRLRPALGDVLTGLRMAGRALRSRSPGNPLAGAISRIGLTHADLLRMIDPRALDAGEVLAARHRDGMATAAVQLAGKLRQAFITAGGALTRLLETDMSPAEEAARPLTPEEAARGCLRTYHRAFELYDMVRYPIFQTLDAGEAAPVDIIRFSPLDARSILVESPGRRKLAGTALFNFGAFLKRAWRENDILWGRLDAAEQILTSHLPVGEDCRKLLEEAHHAIIEEYLTEMKIREWAPFLSEAMEDGFRGKPSSERMRAFIATEFGNAPGVARRLTTLILGCLQAPQWLEYLRTAYEVDRSAEPKALIQYASRGASITGRIFEGIARNRRMTSRPAAIVARLGDFLTGFIQLAVPDSVLGILARRWLNYLYVLDALMLAGGLLWSRPVFGVGLALLSATVLAHIAILFLADLFRGRRVVRIVLALLFFVAIAIPFVLGVRWIVIHLERWLNGTIPLF